MLDLKFIRDNFAQVEAGVRKKNAAIDLSEFPKLDEKRRQILLKAAHPGYAVAGRAASRRTAGLRCRARRTSDRPLGWGTGCPATRTAPASLA